MLAPSAQLTYCCTDLATALGCHVSTVRQMCQRRAIPGARKFGLRNWGIPKMNLADTRGAPGHEDHGGDAEARRRERALREALAMFEDGAALVRRALNE